jgi:hypothetical protein
MSVSATRRCGTIAEIDESEPAAAVPSVDEVECYLRGWQDCMARTRAIYLHDASLSQPDLAMHILFNTSLSEEEAVALLDRLAALAKTPAGPAPAPALGHTNGAEAVTHG